MRKVLQTALLIGVFAAWSFSQQSPDRLQSPERLFLHPQDRPEIIPPGVLADRDPVRVDPQHFKLDFQNERVRVVRLTMKGSEGSQSRSTSSTQRRAWRAALLVEFQSDRISA